MRHPGGRLRLFFRAPPRDRAQATTSTRTPSRLRRRRVDPSRSQAAGTPAPAAQPQARQPAGRSPGEAAGTLSSVDPARRRRRPPTARSCREPALPVEPDARVLGLLMTGSGVALRCSPRPRAAAPSRSHAHRWRSTPARPARAHIGGVERVTRRDGRPAARPAAGPLPGPPAASPRSPIRPGTSGSRRVLPARRPGRRLIYCPANLAPVASRRSVVLIHDVAALRHPEWYGRVYARYQRRSCCR